MKTYLKILFVVFWTGFVLWKFFQRFPFTNLPEVLINGLMLAILLLFFSALGKRIFRHFKISFASFSEELSFSFGLGSGIVIFLIVGLATLRILYEIVVVGLILILVGFVYQDAKSLCLRGYSSLRSFSSKTWNVLDILLLFLMGVAGISTFLAAATPPFFYDALVYHLAVPQQYLLAHGFHYMPHHHFSNFPMNLNMIFLVGMSFSGGLLAKLLSWSFAPLTAIAVYGLAKSRWGRQTALSAAAILFLVPGVLILSTLTSVDLGVMFYSFLSFSALLSWFTSRQTSRFILSGIFCGLAVGTKYTALIMTFGVILIILFSHDYIFAKKRRFLYTLRASVLFGLIVLCVVFPWLVKNTIYTGNPFYPFFNSLLGTRVSHQYTYYDQRISATNPASVLLNSWFENGAFRPKIFFDAVVRYLTAPWHVTMTTSRAAGKTGVVFLLCLPCVLLTKKMGPIARILLAFGVCIFWLWVLLLPQTALRYVFQMFPPLSLVTAYILWSLPMTTPRKLWVMGGVCILLGYHLLLLFQELTILQPYSYVLNNYSKEQFLVEHGVNYYAVVNSFNQEIPQDSKILYVGELRGYYCERSFLLATDAHRIDEAIILQQLIIESRDTQQVIQKLQQLGITHILVNLAEMDRFAKGHLARDSYFDFHTERGEKIFQELFSTYFHLLGSKHQVNFYQILYEQSGA